MLVLAFSSQVIVGSSECSRKYEENCKDSKCCIDAGFQCYQKNQHWASCRDECTKGINPYDPPGERTAWQCKLLSTSAPTLPPADHRRRRRSVSSRRRRRSKRRRRRSSRRRTRRRRRRSKEGDGGERRRRRSKEDERRRRSGGGGGGGGDSSGKKHKGQVTMWVAGHENLIGGQCEFGNSPVNSFTDPVLAPYLKNGFHCAIGDSNPGFGKGEHCGKCYRLTSVGNEGNPDNKGPKGSAVVMVSNSGAGGDAHFDCIMDSYTQITGTTTGIYNVEFEEVTCDLIKGGLVIIDWANEGNAYYCKMMFENVGHWGSLDLVEVCIDGDNCGSLERFTGQTWTGCPAGKGETSKWKLTQKSPKGGRETITCTCTGGWPFKPMTGGNRCKCLANFKGR